MSKAQSFFGRQFHCCLFCIKLGLFGLLLVFVPSNLQGVCSSGADIHIDESQTEACLVSVSGTMEEVELAVSQIRSLQPKCGRSVCEETTGNAGLEESAKQPFCFLFASQNLTLSDFSKMPLGNLLLVREAQDSVEFHIPRDRIGMKLLTLIQRRLLGKTAGESK